MGWRRTGLVLGVRGGGKPGGLEPFQLAQAAIDGALDAGFVAREVGERVSASAIDVEGAGQAVAGVGWGGGRGHMLGVQLVVPFMVDQLPFELKVFGGDRLEALPVDAGLHGEGTVEAPLTGGDAHDQFLFALADGATDDHFLAVAGGLEAVVEVIEEEEKLFGVLVEQEVFVGAQAVDESIAAGCGSAFRGTWTG